MGSVGILLLLTVLPLIVSGRSGEASKGNTDALPMSAVTNVTAEGSTGQSTASVTTIKAKNVVEGGLRAEIGTSTVRGKGLKVSTMRVDKNVTELIGEDVKGYDSHPQRSGHLDECDVASSCIDKNNKLIACLRVPGNDSPTLSLLIQNKGTAAFTITISVPDLVYVEQSSVFLQANEHKKVQVSFEDGVKNKSVSLTAAEWHCNLNFWDVIPDYVAKNERFLVHARDKLSLEATFVLIILAAFMVIGAGLVLIRFKRTCPWGSPCYRILETSLPISTGGVQETDPLCDWDSSNWGDKWDDEEAPPPPSNSSLNLSSRGLASRRSTKEGGTNH